MEKTHNATQNNPPVKWVDDLPQNVAVTPSDGPGRLPIDLRLLTWFDRQIVVLGSPGRFFHRLLLPCRWAGVRILFVAILGPRITKEKFDERQDICIGCERRVGDRCVDSIGEWIRLRFKNRLAGHLCPLQKHAGTYTGWKVAYVRQGCKAISPDRSNDNGR